MSESSNSHSAKAHELLSDAMKLPLGLGKKLFQKALQEAQLIPNAVQQGSFLLEMARVLPESHFDELINIVEKLPNDVYRALILQQIAKRSSQAMQMIAYARAFVAITEISDNDMRETQLQKFAQQAPSQSIEQLLKYVREQPDIYVRTRALVAVSGKMTEQQKRTLYSELLNDISIVADEKTRIQILVYIVKYILPFQMNTALDIARTAKDPNLKAQALLIITMQSRNTSQYNNLYTELLSALRDVKDQQTLTISIKQASDFVPTALVKDVLHLLPRIRKEEVRSQLLAKLSENVHEEHLPEFLLIAKTFSSGELRVYALGEILQYLQSQKRGEVLQTILKDVEEITDKQLSVDLLVAIANKVSDDVNAHLFKVALALARSISDENQRVHALANIPRGLLNEGELKTVEEYERLKSNSRREGAIHFRLIESLVTVEKNQWRLSGNISTDAPPPPPKK